MLCINIKFVKQFSLITITIAILIGIYFPSRHARHYECIQRNAILKNLHFSSGVQNNNLINCTYDNLLSTSDNDIRINDVTQQKVYLEPDSGGEFSPKYCRPSIRSAIIVPYRAREAQLEIFLNFIHHFLQKQKIHYKIYIVDQNNDLPFNRAKLLNIGAKVAISEGFPCLILHDLDLIPLDYSNIYGCCKLPRHMSSSLDTFRYNLPYLTLFGGATAILSEQYKSINGMSNMFEGWGGEDDDFYKRLDESNLTPIRFCPAFSKYTMLIHKKNRVTSQNRFDLLSQSSHRRYEDGLNALPSNFVIEKEPLFTHIIIS